MILFLGIIAGSGIFLAGVLVLQNWSRNPDVRPEENFREGHDD